MQDANAQLTSTLAETSDNLKAANETIGVFRAQFNQIEATVKVTHAPFVPEEDYADLRKHTGCLIQQVSGQQENTTEAYSTGKQSADKYTAERAGSDAKAKKYFSEQQPAFKDQ